MYTTSFGESWMPPCGYHSPESAATVALTVTGHIKFGWSVQPIDNGVAGPAVR